jgi:S-adenosyl-L-methionine hydrolase (adenosine-forming)
MSNTIIALLTDFGLSDNYVGIVKGVIKSIAPDTNIIDISHSLRPQNIKQAAFMLMNSIKFFPESTIFLTVVDPGVGTERHALATKIGNHYFLAPDNGVLSYVIKDSPVKQYYSLTKSEYHLKSISATFHGRDIFAPVAAHIANGVELNSVGVKVKSSDIVVIPNPQCFLDIQEVWHGEVMHIDHFGNIITSLSAQSIGIKQVDSIQDLKTWNFESGDIKIKGLNSTFANVEQGDLLAYIGSSGFLEFGLRDGNAAETYETEIGQNVYAFRS